MSTCQADVRKYGVIIFNGAVIFLIGIVLCAHITLRQEDGILLVKVTNTGIGLNESDKASLLKQSFFRTKEAKKVNPLGMGVGLLVAKTIIDAHCGNISIDSEGEGKEVRAEIKLTMV